MPTADRAAAATLTGKDRLAGLESENAELGSADREGTQLRSWLFYMPSPTFIRSHWRPSVLLLLSAVLAAVYIVGRPYILFNDGDPLTYFRKAWWFINHEGGMDVPSRGPGYPIWLILTGAAWLNTWWLLVVSHIAMAVAAPVLVYGILAPVSRNAGFAAGLLFTAFGISFMHMNWIMTEELFLFMELVSLLLVSWHLHGAWPPLPDALPAGLRWTARLRRGLSRYIRSVYAIAVALAYTTMVKPAAGPFFWLFVLVCLLFRVQPWKRYIGPVVLYAAIMTAWGTHDYLRGPVRFSPLGMPISQAQRNFADVYYGLGFQAVNGWTPVAPHERDAERLGRDQADAPKAGSVDGMVASPSALPPTILPKNGPASQKLYQVVAAHIDENLRSGRWNVSDADSAFHLYDRYGSAVDLVQAVFVRPNPFYFQLIVAAAASAGDTLLLDVAREHGNAGLVAYLKYLARHPTVPLLGPPNPYVGFMFLMKFYRYRDFIDAKNMRMRDLFLNGYRENLVSEDNGPATRAYAESIRFFIDAVPQHVFYPGLDYLSDFGTVDAFKHYVIESPYLSKYSGGMMGNIYQWMLLLYGEEPTGRLMGAAGLESMFKKSAGFGMVVGDYLAALVYSGAGYPLSVPDLLTNFGAGFSGVRSTEDAVLTATVESAKQTQLPPSMARHVGVIRERGDFSKDMAATLAISYGAFKWAKPILFAGVVVFTMPLLMIGFGGRLVALLVPAYFLSAAAFTAVMIMPTSDPRHEEVYAFFALLVTVLGVAAIPRFICFVRGAGPVRKAAAPGFRSIAKRP